MIELVRSNPQEKKLIFVQSRETLARIGGRLAEAGLSFARFDGSLSGPEKDAAIAEFRDHAPVLLCTQSGGEGRNIQFCNTLINFDVPWNPMAIEQRIGRIDRIGQEREVFVFNLVTRGTLEEQVLALLEEKIAMFELVVGEVGAILGALEEEREFPDLVLEAWLETTEAARAEAFEALGQRLDRCEPAASGRQGAGREAVRRGLRGGVRTRHERAARVRCRPAGQRRCARRAGRAGRPRRAGAGAAARRHGLARAGAAGVRRSAAAGSHGRRARGRLARPVRGTARQPRPSRRAPARASGPFAPPGDPERRLESALDLGNAIWRLRGATPAWTRCLLLALRYAATSDERREGLVWLGFNAGTGAVLGDDLVERLRHVLAGEPEWRVPDPAVRAEAGRALDAQMLAERVRGAVDHLVRCDLEPFLRAMRRRLDRDSARVHAYHDDLRRSALTKLAGLQSAAGDKADADRKRESLRVAAIEREYAAKLDDLRHNYALRVTVDWVQGLILFAPVHRYEVLIRRRKGERIVSIDWHPAARMMEPPLCEWGTGLERARLVCDERLHLTDLGGQAPCQSCGKAWCRACHGPICPRCKRATAASSEIKR